MTAVGLESGDAMDLQKLRLIAAQELIAHDLVGWTFAFGSSKRRLGACKYRTRRIEIAEYYAAHSPDGHVLDTLRHEIAHALAGPKAGHGPAWRAVAVRLGAQPVACDRTGEAVVEPGDWQSACAGCGRTHHRYRRPPSLAGYRCACAARTPLTYEYKGNAAFAPAVPEKLADAPGWFAVCEGCKAMHRKIRRPKAGKWLCRCRHASGLTWQWGLATRA